MSEIYHVTVCNGSSVPEMLDQRFWRARAHRAIQSGLSALQRGDIPFGDWERLHLSAAIDDFRLKNYEAAFTWAQRIMDIQRNRRPFPGKFGHRKSFSEFCEEFQQLIASPEEDVDRGPTRA